jgi:GMP synthase PP-ATPase subunit
LYSALFLEEEEEAESENARNEFKIWCKISNGKSKDNVSAMLGSHKNLVGLKNVFTFQEIMEELRRLYSDELFLRI